MAVQSLVVDGALQAPAGAALPIAPTLRAAARSAGGTLPGPLRRCAGWPASGAATCRRRGRSGRRRARRRHRCSGSAFSPSSTMRSARPMARPFCSICPARIAPRACASASMKPSNSICTSGAASRPRRRSRRRPGGTRWRSAGSGRWAWRRSSVAWWKRLALHAWVIGMQRRRLEKQKAPRFRRRFSWVAHGHHPNRLSCAPT